MWKTQSRNSQRRVSVLHLPTLVERPVVTNERERIDAITAAIGAERRRLDRLVAATNACREKINALRIEMRSLKPDDVSSMDLRNAFLDQVRATVSPELWREMMNKAVETARSRQAKLDDMVVISVKKSRKNVGAEIARTALLTVSGEG